MLFVQILLEDWTAIPDSLLTKEERANTRITRALSGDVSILVVPLSTSTNSLVLERLRPLRNIQ